MAANRAVTVYRVRIIEKIRLYSSTAPFVVYRSILFPECRSTPFLSGNKLLKGRDPGGKAAYSRARFSL